MVIRENIDQYMKELKEWLSKAGDCPPEEMSAFFAERLDIYEEHMSVWEPAYRRFAQLLPDSCSRILDLGCGTGLELDWLWRRMPELQVTGVDMCRGMLEKLEEKHKDKNLTLICEDYFKYDMGRGKYDAVLSFESLHHFFPEQKRELYRRVYQSLKEGGLLLLGDYIACCREEEELLAQTYMEMRKQHQVPETRWIHFDIPLTLEHEMALMEEAGFSNVRAVDSINGATFIMADKAALQPVSVKLTTVGKTDAE